MKHGGHFASIHHAPSTKHGCALLLTPIFDRPRATRYVRLLGLTKEATDAGRLTNWRDPTKGTLWRLSPFAPDSVRAPSPPESKPP